MHTIPSFAARAPRAARAVRLGLAFVALATAAGCAAGGGGGGASTPAPSTTPTAPAERWPIRTWEHVDLWMHGYAMLQADTSRVPLFRRGYRDRIAAVRRQRGASTLLDANTERLRARLASNPALVNGQFVPLYFGTWEDMRRLIDLFLQAQGNFGNVPDPGTRMGLSVLAGSFPAAADREWLRLFVQSLDDERAKFYGAYWRGERNARAAVYTAVDSLWRTRWRGRLDRFLTNTRLESGELVLSMPLDGEGRTITLSQRQNAVAVTFPETPDAAAEALYVFVHEIMGNVAQVAITDNTTPVEQRSGVTAQYTAHAAVRGGALLLERTMPELVPGYMRYYLRSAGASIPASNVDAAFASTFSIPQAIRDAISKQLDVVLGGI
jgi:hypothetical protein